MTGLRLEAIQAGQRPAWLASNVAGPKCGKEPGRTIPTPQLGWGVGMREAGPCRTPTQAVKRIRGGHLAPGL